jgi:hypothetical protein
MAIRLTDEEQAMRAGAFGEPRRAAGVVEIVTRG